MKNVTDSGQKVKGQKSLMALERASWILGIDVGKEKLSCALLLLAAGVIILNSWSLLSVTFKSGGTLSESPLSHY